MFHLPSSTIAAADSLVESPHIFEMNLPNKAKKTKRPPPPTTDGSEGTPTAAGAGATESPLKRSAPDSPPLPLPLPKVIPSETAVDTFQPFLDHVLTSRIGMQSGTVRSKILEEQVIQFIADKISDASKRVILDDRHFTAAAAAAPPQNNI